MAFENIGPGVYGPYINAGAPVAGTNETQTITFGGTITGGTFTLTLEGVSTAAITHTGGAMAGAAMVTAINTALNTTFGSAQIVASAGTFASGVGTILLTFSGSTYARRAVSTMTANSSLTGTSPTIAIAETTPGVTQTLRNVQPGALMLDTTNQKLYVNTGTTAGAPTWTVAGAQS